jgi:hypothetical protein
VNGPDDLAYEVRNRTRTPSNLLEEQKLGTFAFNDRIEPQNSLKDVAVEILLGNQAAQVPELDELPSASNSHTAASTRSTSVCPTSYGGSNHQI